MLYFRIREGWISAMLLKGGIAIKERSGAFGVEGKDKAVRLIEDSADPVFRHPRLVFDRFERTEAALRLLLAEMGIKPAMLGTRRCLIHVQRDLAGGLTDIEIRALIEVFEGPAGCLAHLLVSLDEIALDQLDEVWRRQAPRSTTRA